jgi:hypothetical protein
MVLGLFELRRLLAMVVNNVNQLAKAATSAASCKRSRGLSGLSARSTSLSLACGELTGCGGDPERDAWRAHRGVLCTPSFGGSVMSTRSRTSWRVRRRQSGWPRDGRRSGATLALARFLDEPRAVRHPRDERRAVRRSALALRTCVTARSRFTLRGTSRRERSAGGSRSATAARRAAQTTPNLVIALVAEGGSKARVHNDRPRAITATAASIRSADVARRWSGSRELARPSAGTRASSSAGWASRECAYAPAARRGHGCGGGLLGPARGSRRWSRPDGLVRRGPPGTRSDASSAGPRVRQGGAGQQRASPGVEPVDRKPALLGGEAPGRA